ncbi:MAG: hypothetical protein ACW99U_09950 [Candidatus Thorarchaeota archaeon]
MSDSTLYSRRLAETEADVWVALVNDVAEAIPGHHIEPDLVDQFLKLEDTICYVSTISGEAVGGVAVFVDKVRRALAIVDVILKPGFRERLLYTLLKSALPFFRTVMIREVDVLLRSSGLNNQLPFPFASALDEWTLPVLDRLDFEESESVFHYTFELSTLDELPRYVLTWDRDYDTAKIVDLFWKVKDDAHLDFSHVLLALGRAGSGESLITASSKTGELLMATSLEMFGKTCIVGPAMIDKDRVEPTAFANDILRRASLQDCSTLEIPIVGEGQMEYIEAISALSMKEPVVKELKLLRKNL